MAINFPSSPTNGQIFYDPNSGNRYFFDSVAGRWIYAANNEPFPIVADTQLIFNNNGGLDGSTGLTFNPTSNTLFTNTINASANIYADFFVGSGSALTDINAVTISNTAPTPAQAGDLWWDPNRGRFFIYYDDGTSTQWVETSPTGSGGGGSGGGGSSTDLSPVYLYANGIYDLANAAFNRANSSNDVLFVISSYDTANQAYTVTNAAFDKANTVALDLANTAIAANNYAGSMANSVNTFTSATYSTLTQWGFSFAVTNAAYTVTNAAFAKANSALANTTDTVFNGNLRVSGTVSVPVFYENDANITSNISITVGRNAMTAGPVTLNNGVVVEVPSGSTWTIV